MEEVLNRITRDDLVSLVLQLCNIPSPYGREGEAAEFVYNWLGTAGLEPRRIALIEDRPNVVGPVRGTGGGQSHIFNSHLDTVVRPEDTLRHLYPADPIYYHAWADGDEVYGEGVVNDNDKGPIACLIGASIFQV